MTTTYLDSLFSLRGRTAAVTGGSSGIGLAIATALARAGARVVLLARTTATLDAAAAAIAAHPETGPGAVATAAADLADPADLAAAPDALRAPFGDPDILVTSAGVNIRPPMGDLTPDQWRRTMALNVDAPFLLGQALAPAMTARGWGRILNIGSQQTFRAFGNSGAYGVSKAAVAALSRSQAEAWSRHGVTSNTLVPGWVSTPLTAEVAADPARTAALAARTMTGRNGVPADFAGAAVFLASAAGAAVTGQTLAVDHGFSAT